jgi:hypothetical protein
VNPFATGFGAVVGVAGGCLFMVVLGVVAFGLCVGATVHQTVSP